MGRLTPARDVTNLEEIEKAVGKTDVVLGPIPTPEELRRDLKSLEETMEREKLEVERIAELAKKERMGKFATSPPEE